MYIYTMYIMYTTIRYQLTDWTLSQVLYIYVQYVDVGKKPKAWDLLSVVAE